jgi:hypothetical protein
MWVAGWYELQLKQDNNNEVMNDDAAAQRGQQ